MRSSETGHVTAQPTPLTLHRRPPEDEPVVVDCDSCVVRSAAACGDCVVTVLLGAPPQGIELHADEQVALDALADSGLVPPLRLVRPMAGPGPAHADAG